MKNNSGMIIIITKICLFAALTTPICLTAQGQQTERTAAVTANPVPFINQPLVPNAIPPGTAGFVLTVNGTGFVQGSAVQWNGSKRVTTFVSVSQLKASILVTDVTKASTARVSVVNPTPAGGTSNVAFFEITRPTASVALRTSSVRPGTSAAVADFNEDGKLDLAVAEPGNNSVSILLGNGDGTFRVPMNYKIGTNPTWVAVGDFDKDGKLDLAVANFGGGNVGILLGNGDGTFRAPVYYATGNSPNMIAVADFNRDGKLDLAVVNGGNGNGVSSVSILLGNGDGTFHSAGKYPASFAKSVAVGDFNKDGKLDLAVVNFGTSNVSVFLGNGDGSFQPAVNYGADNASTWGAVGDFNGDGNLDLAVTNIISNSGLGDVSVLLGNGDGTFQPAVNYGVGSNPSSVAVGDFNGDGKLDFAVTNYGGYSNGVSSVSILLGNGDGTFQPATEYIGVGSLPSSITAGDFNGDGRLDIVVAGSTVTALLQPHLVSGLSAILEPANVTFALTQLVGTTGSALPIQLSNYGTTTVGIDGIMANGDFLQTHTCSSSLAAGDSCTINVIFKPTQGGTRTGTLSVMDNAPGSPQSISLSGMGTVVNLSPDSLGFVCGPFGPFRSCVCSPPETTTLTNVGKTVLDISGITITGPFSQTNTCAANLGAGNSCAITVTWNRTSGFGNISVGDDGGASPQTVALAGHKLCTPP